MNNKNIKNKKFLFILFVAVTLGLLFVFYISGLFGKFIDNYSSNFGNVNFVYTMAPDVEIGETQRIFVSFTNEEDSQNAKLEYHKEGCSSNLISATQVCEEVAEFELPFVNKEEAGKYTLDNVYTGENMETVQKLDVFEDRGYTFAVHAKIESYTDDELPAGIYDISGNGLVSKENKIGENNAKMMMSNSALNLQPSQNGPFVVALDAGHGGSDPGACGGGLTEKAVNLRIAQACRDELQQYNGVSVYMVRNSDEYVGLQERVERARANGANLFVCLHNNSGGGTGAEVGVQHPGGGQSGFYDIGSAIGNKVLARLQGLFGLENRGIKYKYCTDGSIYPDGSQGDYYSVLYGSRYYSIPGILIEHAFIDTQSWLLAVDSNLVEMGKADAKSIADVYGFTKDAPVPYVKWMDDCKMSLAGAPVVGATKYAVYRIENGRYITYSEDYHDTEYVFDNLENGTEYQFLVQAFVNGHGSAYTEDNFFKVRLLPVPGPIDYRCAGDGEIELSWHTLKNATKYAVAEFKNNEYVTYSYDVYPEGTTAKFKIGNLSCGTEHKFLVQAYFCNQWWSYFDDTCLTICVAQGPDKPYNITAVPDVNSITFSGSPIPGVVSYNIAFKNNDGTYTNYYTDSSASSYKVEGLECCGTYYYIVQAFFDVGQGTKFADDDFVSIKTLNDPSRPSPTASVGDGTVTLTGPQVQGASKYAIYKVEGNRFIPYTEDTVKTTYEITNLPNHKEHIFLVQAYSKSGWSKFHEGNYIKATPIGPVKPTINNHISGSHSIKLNWEKVSGATKYAVASQNTSGTFTTYTFDCQNTFYTVTGLDEGKEYKFLVQAYIDGCWSKFDVRYDLYAASTEDTRPMPKAVTGGDGEIVLTWEPIKNAEKYAIYEVMDSGAYVPFNENGKDVTFHATNLANGYSHRFLVQACVADSGSTISSDYFVIAEAKGNVKPYDIKGVPGSHSIELTWGHVAGASQYAVATKNSSGTYTTYTLNCTSDYYVINGLIEDCNYEVLIQACIYGKGSKFIEKDDLKSFRTVNTKPKPSAKKSGDGKVTLSGKAIENADKYALYEVTGYSFRVIDENVTDTTYEVSNLANNYYHNFLVQSHVGGSWSTIDPSLYVGDTPEGHIKPGDVNASGGYRQINLNGSQVPGAEKYAIATKNDDGKYTTYTLNCTTTNYSITNLQEGKTYYCLVQAYIMGQGSHFIEIDDLVEAITLDTRPVIDKNSPMGDGSVNLMGSCIKDAEKYAIYEILSNGGFRVISENGPSSSCECYVDNLANNYPHTFLVQSCVNGFWSSFNASNYAIFTPTGTVKPKILPYDHDINYVVLHGERVPGAEKYAIAQQISESAFKTYTYDCKDLSYALYLRGGDKYKFLIQAFINGKGSQYDPNVDIFDVYPDRDPLRPRPVVTEVGNGHADLSWDPIAGATKYAIASKNGDGSFTTYTYDCVETSYSVVGLKGGDYEFLVQSFVNGSWCGFNDGDLVYANVPSSQTLIMYPSRTTIQQMVNYFNASGHSYEYRYSAYGAPDIETFCTICYQEATDEGVDPAVLFCQAMHETGGLGFGGIVFWYQCNFGGIGATDHDPHAATFPDVRTGLRAQVQHLKAYGSRFGNLVHPLVDPRFHLVTRGICPNVEDLGGHGASGAYYGYSIVASMEKLFKY